MRKPDERGFALINKNLCNYPIARDRRLKLHWRKSQTTGLWLCDLDDKIQLRLPSNTPSPARRCPTALDMGILFALLSEVEKRDTTEIELQSHATLLRLLGYSVEARNRQKVKDALSLWCELRLWFREWYFAKSFHDHHAPTRSKNELLPPIRSIRILSGRICITIADEWRALAKRFFSRVPLPLPRDAAAQNLALAVLVSHYEWDNGHKHTKPRRVRRLCRKIGLNHHNSAARLHHALRIVEDWFDQHGGQLTYLWPPGSNRIQFAIVKDVKGGGRKPKERGEPVPMAPETEAPQVRVHTDEEIHRAFSGAPEDEEAEWKTEFDADMAAKGIVFDDAFDAELKYERWLKSKLRRDNEERGRPMALTNDERGRHR